MTKVTKEAKEAIEKLLEYVTEDEFADFIAQGKPPEHIYAAIQTLQKWVTGK